MSGNAIDVPVIVQLWGFVVVDSIVASLYFISSGPSGTSSGPFEHHQVGLAQLRPLEIAANITQL